MKKVKMVSCGGVAIGVSILLINYFGDFLDDQGVRVIGIILILSLFIFVYSSVKEYLKK